MGSDFPSQSPGCQDLRLHGVHLPALPLEALQRDAWDLCCPQGKGLWSFYTEMEPSVLIWAEKRTQARTLLSMLSLQVLQLETQHLSLGRMQQVW